MKRFLARFFFLLLLGAGGSCLAAEAPVFVAHHFGKVTKGDKTTVDLVLHVVNRDAPITDLALSVLPLSRTTKGGASLKVGRLAPNQRVDLSVVMEVPADVSKGRMLREPLSLGGRCLDAEGNVVEFATKSHRGGAL